MTTRYALVEGFIASDRIGSCRFEMGIKLSLAQPRHSRFQDSQHPSHFFIPLPTTANAPV
jgi:hypothetical protein